MPKTFFGGEAQQLLTRPTREEYREEEKNYSISNSRHIIFSLSFLSVFWFNGNIADSHFLLLPLLEEEQQRERERSNSEWIINFWLMALCLKLNDCRENSIEWTHSVWQPANERETSPQFDFRFFGFPPCYSSSVPPDAIIWWVINVKRSEFPSFPRSLRSLEFMWVFFGCFFGL